MNMNFKILFAAIIVLAICGSMSFAQSCATCGGGGGTTISDIVNHTLTVDPTNSGQYIDSVTGIKSPACANKDMEITDPTASYQELFGTQFWQSRGSGFSLAFTNGWKSVCNTDWYVDGVPVQYTNYRGALGCNTPNGIRAWILINVDNVTAKDGSSSKALEYGYHDIYGMSQTAHGWITESYQCHETTKHISLYVNKLPTVSIVPGTSTMFVKGKSNTLGAAVSDTSDDIGSLKVYWDFNNDWTYESTGLSAAHTFSEIGTYNVNVKVVDRWGAEGYKTTTINVIENTVPALVANFTYNCTDLTCSFYDTSVATNTTITSRFWDFGNGKNSTATNPVMTFAISYDYTVKLTVKTSTLTNTATKVVSVSAQETTLPTADFSVICDKLKCTFTDESQNAESIAWDFDDGTTSAQSNVVHYFDEAGTYHIELTATNSFGEDTFYKTLTVNSDESAPTAKFSVNCNPDTLKCIFTGASTEGSSAITETYWDFGDGSDSYAKSPTHTYDTDGEYDVTLTVTDENDLTDELTKTVDVSADSSTGPTAKFSYECDDSLKCKFTDDSSEGDYGINEYYWDFGDGEDSYSTNPTHTYDSADEYEVTLTVTDDEGNDDSVSRNVDVTENGLVINAGTATTVAQDAIVQFAGTAVSDSKILLYEWDFDMNGSFKADYMNTINGVTSHAYSNAGIYNAVFKVTTASGSSMATRTITVTKTAVDVTTTGSSTYETDARGMSSARTYLYNQEANMTTIKLRIMNGNETAQTVMIRDIIPKTFAEDIYSFDASPQYTKVYNIDPELGWQTTIKPYETYTITYTFEGYKSLAAMKKGFSAPVITLVSSNETVVPSNNTAFTGLTAFVVGAFADPIMALIILLVIIVVIVVLWAWTKNKDDKDDNEYDNFGTQALIKKDLEMQVKEHNLDMKMDESKHSFDQKMDESKKTLEQELRDKINLLAEKQKMDQRKQNEQMKKKVKEIRNIQQAAKKQIKEAKESAKKDIKAAKADLNATKKEVKQDIKGAVAEKKK